MTSPASTTSWFSGIARNTSGKPSSSSAMLSGGVASAPAAWEPAHAQGVWRKKLQGTKYGTKSAQDALELDQLISYLINKENSEGVILLGHSTGCQDIVHYMRTDFACSKAVSGVILQAPVSDREYRATLPETAEMIDLAAKMISEGREMDLMPRESIPDAPITAYGYHSLCAYMGDDDMFSSDLSEDQLRQRFGHMSTTQCQVIFSMGDEYAPEYVDKKALVDR